MNSFQWVFDAIGTSWVIDIQNRISSTKKQELFTIVIKHIKTKLAKNSGTYPISGELESLLFLYHLLYEKTNGAFTPLIGSVLEDAGYGASYSFKEKTLKKPPTWDQVISYSASQLTIKKSGYILDFGAAGKGYLVDSIGLILEKNNISSYCIDASGDIRYRQKNKKKIRVGLENPLNTKQVIGVVNLSGQSICGSSGNRRAWGTYHHIINPLTLTSPSEILSTWVIADTTVISDALATALFFIKPEIFLKDFSFHYAILYKDYSIVSSKDFPGEFYYTK